jgi:co-chaperonin GroES (HSP10)
MSTVEPVSGLIPLNDCVLVELQQSFKNVSVKEGKYDTRTEGVVVAIPVALTGKFMDENGTTVEDLELLKGMRIFFEEYKEGSRIQRNGRLYSFIKIEDIRGYESV